MLYTTVMLNKENLLYFFLTKGKINLSHYDFNFMSNLQSMIHRSARVTSGQAELFDVLISKYARQLAKHGLDKDELKRLSWKAECVESTPEYTGAVVSVDAGILKLRVPFNKNFIRKITDTVDSLFMWNREEKLYMTDFSTVAFKIAHTIPQKYFQTIQYSDELNVLLEKINSFGTTAIWDPTLKKVNGHFVIAASNEWLDCAIKDIELNDDPKTLLTLSTYGINIDPAICVGNKKLEFAASRIVEIEFADIETIIGWCKELGCTTIMLGRGAQTGMSRMRVKKLTEVYGLDCIYSFTIQPVLGLFEEGEVPSEEEVDDYTVLIQHTSAVTPVPKSVCKTIIVKNSDPIEVK